MSFTFKYTDGTVRVEYFERVRDAAVFANQEGDHLVSWTAGDWSSNEEGRIDVV